MTRFSRRVAWLASLAITLAVLPAAAHHSFAMFDQKKVMTLEGTVHEFQWTNPHAFIELDVDSGARAQRWAIELNSPNNLTRQGWRRTSLKPGDRVRIWVHPLRSGARGASYVGVRLPDGSTLGDVN